MSNLKTKFESKLTRVVQTIKNDRAIYTATFEDGTNAVIRTSERDYTSVAQVHLVGWDRATGKSFEVPATEFLFSNNPSPKLSKYQQPHHVVTLQIEK